MARDVQMRNGRRRPDDRQPIQRTRRRKRRKQRLVFRFVSLLLCLVVLVGALCYELFLRDHDIELVYAFERTNPITGIEKVTFDLGRADSVASKLCVAPLEDVGLDGLSIDAASAGIFSEADRETVYAKSIFERRYPASLTKVMTCLVALKYGNLDDVVTVGEECKDIEYGSSVAEIMPGDVLTLRELLLGLMINSGNDAAMTIAVHVGGSVEGFVELMNQEAARIGATQTHFTNPHGLQDENHYTTVYDMYLMFHEALKYSEFQDLISRHNYYITITNTSGVQRDLVWESTNHYFINEAIPPKDVEVIGGKTGTTSDAGACLVLYSKNKYGNPYITIIMNEPDRDSLYMEMNELLGKINEN